MSVAVFSPIFPNALPFLPQFFRSLTDQTFTDFKLWLALDRLSVDEVAEYVPPGLRVQWVPAEAHDNPARLRKRTWSSMVSLHDAIVMIDSDDIAHPERVESAAESLESSEVNACALRIVDKYDAPVGAVLSLPQGAEILENVHHWNVFGLSNTAYRAEALDPLIQFPDGIGIIDWHLLARAVRLELSLSFTTLPLLDYRQYAANTARILPPLPLDYVRRATGFVRTHLNGLLQTVPSGNFAEGAAARLLEVEAFADADDAAIRRSLSRHLPSSQNCYLWWEYVAPPGWRG